MNLQSYFATPIYVNTIDGFLPNALKVTDSYIKAAQKKAAAIRNAKKAKKLLDESRKDISDVLLYSHIS